MQVQIRALIMGERDLKVSPTHLILVSMSMGFAIMATGTYVFHKLVKN